MLRFTHFASFAFVAFVAFPLNSQGFGKNRLLTRDFPYRVWETDHFLIHYYEANPLLLEETAKNLEAAYQDITRRLDAKPNKRIPFFLYTNHNEFEQTRVVDIGEGTGGVTEAFKDRLLIFNSGSLVWLRHVIYHEFTHSVEFAVLNAGFWKSARLVKTILYPLWLMEGLAEYMAGTIDETTDNMYARDAATSKKSPPFDLKDLHNFNHLKPNQVTRAYKQGALVMKFITEEYGEEKLGEILKSFWSRYDIASVLMDVLGIDLERLNRNFKEWLEENFAEPSKNLDEPSRYGERFTKSLPPIPVFRWSAVASPDGKRIYYISLREGFPGIYEDDLSTGKRKLLVGRESGSLDWIALENRNLGITQDGRYLYFIGEKNLVEHLYRFDLIERRLISRRFPSFIALKSPNPNPQNANEVVLSAMEDGFNDLYVVDFEKGEILSRLTHDPQDDDHPVFSSDGTKILYSSEMPITPEGYPNRDLFLLDLVSKAPQAMTSSPSVEKEPILSREGSKIYFIGDANGAWNLYEMDLNSRQIFRRTNVIGGVFSPFPTEGSVLYASFRDGEIDIYRGSVDKFLSEEVSSLLVREEVPKAREAPVPNLRDRGPYKTQFSSDLFFPAFFFSTQGGLFALSYWQGSDMLGYHNLANQFLVNSGSDLLDYTLNYSYSRYRSDFLFVFKGSHYSDLGAFGVGGDFLKKREHLQAALVSYPLDRFNRLETGVSFVERYHKFPSENTAVTNLQDFRVLAQYIRDTTTAPYLVVTRGSRLLLGARRALEVEKFDLDYLTKTIEWHQYVPLLKDSALASRLELDSSSGRDVERFSLGGLGNIRGYPLEPAGERYRNVLIHNAELRFPLVPDLNYHMWYMFPDFYIKNIYLGLFSDQGIRWNNSTKELVREGRLAHKSDFFHSVGVSLKLNTFILETFPFFFSLEWAKRTTAKGAIFYGSVFQYFRFK